MGPLNGSTVTDSRVAINGYTGSAAAYGNVAQNSASLEGGAAPMLVSAWQTNTAPVSAQTNGRFTLAAPSNGFYAANGSVSGNMLAASAFGNHASNMISASR